MKEQIIVNYIESQLKNIKRYYINNHGSTFSKNGTPDFITLDKNNNFLAIEAKVPGKAPVINQWRRCIEILLSGGRFIVAQDDFDINKVDDNKLPKVKIGHIIGESEFIAGKLKIKCTTEVILDKN